jgi:hypothetical protein
MEREISRSLAFIKLSLLDAVATWELSDSLSCLYTALYRLSLIAPPRRPYSSDELRYELRMRPFSAIGHPVLPTFGEFKAAVEQPNVATEELLQYAGTAISHARKGFEALSKMSSVEAFCVGSYDRWLPATKNCLRSCIAAGVAVSTVQNMMKAPGGPAKVDVVVPTPDKAYHEWWIVPKISPLR